LEKQVRSLEARVEDLEEEDDELRKPLLKA